MDINELESFKLSDAVKFHDNLNPALWTKNGELLPEVRKQLMVIAKDFLSFLGVPSFKVEDITISGSNAAYSYTPHSDIDLHILVDFNKLPNDEVYKELFTAKKQIYNDDHNITIHNVPVELYVQDSNQKHVTLGEYSLLKNKWIKIPTKRRANFDQTDTRIKYEKLGKMIELALKVKDLGKVEKVLDIIKRYRKAGLDKHGEFGPENLAYKALRKQGIIQDLFDLRKELHGMKLSIESAMDEDYDPNGPPPGPEFKPTMPKGTIRVDVSDVYDWYKLGQHISNMKGLGKHDFGKGPPSTILSFGDEDLEHQYIQALNKTGLDVTDIDPKGHEPKKGIKTDPTYNVNEILDKESAAKVYWSKENYMTDAPVSQMYTLHTAAAQDKNKNILKYNFYNFPKHDLTAIEFSRAVGPWGDNFGIDNAGDQYTVFATLVKTIEEYLSKHKTKFLMFGAKEPSRAKLYQAFVNRFANKFGYKQISPDSIPKPVSSMILNSGDTPFLLQKVGSKEVKESVKFIEGTNCKNCVWWKKDSEKPVGKDELNKYGGLKPPNKEYIAMSKRVDLVTLPGKDTVKVKGFCYHKDINDWVTERMCCALWDGKGVIRDYKGESPLMEGGAETSWSDGNEKITLQDILELTKHIKQINLPINDNLKNKLIHWDGNPEEIERINQVTVSNQFPILVMLDSQGQIDWILDGNHRLHKAIRSQAKTIPAKLIKPSDLNDKAKRVFHIKEASGYIPSEKEKNDPRFKTALTADVKPDSIKKNAKAFGFKVSRDGRPPLLRKQ